MEPRGLPKAVPLNDLECLTGPNGTIEPKEHFPKLSQPPSDPKKERAGPPDRFSPGLRAWAVGAGRRLAEEAIRRSLHPEDSLAKELARNRLLAALRDDFEPAFRAWLSEHTGGREALPR